MKYIVLDTNIFYNHWFLDTPIFQLLLNYIENTGSILLLPEVVCEEVQNKYDSESKSAKSSFEKALNRLSDFYPEKPKLTFEDNKYDFKAQVNAKVQEVVIFDCTDVDINVIVTRAIKVILPFKENEKGFRDTLIWLSTLAFLKKNNISDPVVFITNNYTDYFDKETRIFKPDLVTDINSHQLPCTIEPFISLNAFFGTLSDEEYKSVDMKVQLDQFIVDNERNIEDKIEDFVNQLSPQEFQKLFSLNLRYPFIDPLLDFDFEIIEGIEDLITERRYKLNTGDYFITVDLDLRACVFLFGIPQNDYLNNKALFDKEFTDHYFAENQFAYFNKHIRPRMKINLLLDPATKSITKVEIVYATFRVKT